ncbi:hypothetical protein OS493_034269 [Desmophyllum pertusum]|uniref:Uncharacterized protein n=1 Tax=Desmophyllum pertusum TaxID=174260 RepID=A0A9X0CNZ0_9CNID|nr:hypothetical protein OS493_034269 [Desmophyllum pertusum]
MEPNKKSSAKCGDILLKDARNSLEVDVPAYHHKQRRNAPTISLQQIRQEIDNKLSQACTSTDKLCQVGPQGPPGDPGNHGYPGYKGEKGARGIPAHRDLWVLQGLKGQVEGLDL